MRNGTRSGDAKLLSRAAAVNQKIRPPSGASKPKAASSPSKKQPPATGDEVERTCFTFLSGARPLPASPRQLQQALTRRWPLPTLCEALQRLARAGFIVCHERAETPEATTWTLPPDLPKKGPEATPPRRKDAPIPDALVPALIRLANLCEESIRAEYEDGSAMLEGTRDLVAHHPELREYHEAMHWIVEGEKKLNALYGHVQYGKRVFGSCGGALRRMADLYEDAGNGNFGDGINKLVTAGDLITHHPGLRDYSRAIRWMADGYSIILEMIRQVRAL